MTNGSDHPQWQAWVEFGASLQRFRKGTSLQKLVSCECNRGRNGISRAQLSRYERGEILPPSLFKQVDGIELDVEAQHHGRHMDFSSVQLRRLDLRLCRSTIAETIASPKPPMCWKSVRLPVK